MKNNLIFFFRGSFLFPSNATLQEKFGELELEAHPACKVHPKALSCSQNLPNELKVNLVPQSPLLNDLFGNDAPDFDDIALYFFPTDQRFV